MQPELQPTWEKVDEKIITIVGGIHFSVTPEESLISFPEIEQDFQCSVRAPIIDKDRFVRPSRLFQCRYQFLV